MIKRIYLLLMLFGGCLFSMRAAIKEEIYVNHIADTVTQTPSILIPIGKYSKEELLYYFL